MSLGGTTDGFPFPEYSQILPQEDRAHLHGLSHSELLSWTTSRAEAYNRMKHALLIIHNGAVPMHRLPTEILSNIFARCWYNRGSFRIAHVCRRWRAVVLSTPHFWRDVLDGEVFDLGAEAQRPDDWSGRFKFMKVLFKFSRFRDIRLHLSHFDDIFGDYLQQRYNARGAQIISLHIELFSDDEFYLLYAALVSGMPFLKELEIKYNEDTLDPFTLDHEEPLPSSSLPFLKTLTTPPTTVRLLALESIEHVTLTPPRIALFAPLPEIYELHSSCTNLKSLQLLLDCELSQIASTLPPAPPITFPVLQSLTIQDSIERNACMLSGVLALPALEKLHAIQLGSCRLRDEESREANHMLRNDSEVVHRLLSKTGVERVALEEERDHPEERDRMSGVAVRVSSNGTEHIRITVFRGILRGRDFMPMFSSYKTITHLSLNANDKSTFTVCGEDNLFRAFSCLEALCIVSPIAVTLLDALAARNDSRDPQSLVAPHLKTLSISFPFSDPDPGHLTAAVRWSEWSPAAQRTIAEHLRPRCTIIRKTLEHRAALGTRLCSLEWSEFEHDPEDYLYWNSARAVVTQLPTDGDEWDTSLMNFGLGALQNLVDGLAIFKGFLFYPPEYRSDGETSSKHSEFDDSDGESDDDGDMMSPGANGPGTLVEDGLALHSAV